MSDFPLSAADDYLIHQTPDPVRVMWTSDARAYERYWAVVHDDTGDLMLAVGGSFYPTLDVAEAFAVVNRRGRHRAVRAGRALGTDRFDLGVGPLRPTIVEGLKSWRYELGPNPYGMTFDIEFFDETSPVFRDARSTPVTAGHPFGRQPESTSGFETFGTAAGWVELDGQRLELDRETFHGTRDRHWGTRNGVGGPAHLLGAPPPRGGIGFQFVDFGDWAIWADRLFYRSPRQPGQPDRVTHITRRLSFEPETHIFAGGVVENVLANGEKRTLEYTHLGHQTVYLRCGLYGGPNGGAPGSGRWHGMWEPDETTEGEVVDLTDPERRTALAGLDEHHCAVTCEGARTTGLFQSYDTRAYDRCLNGVPGWTFL